MICQNVATTPCLPPWREAALEPSDPSGLALPLQIGDDEVAVLAIYSGRPEAFNDDEVELLERLANNMAYGIRALRTRIDLKKQKRVAQHRAYRDLLTGLPNRQWVMEELYKLDTEAARHERLTAALFLDLDGFKRINDSLGHEVGDRLLRLVAHRLREIAREEDFVARLGGDEFLILMHFEAQASSASQRQAQQDALLRAASQLADRLVDGLQQPFIDGSLEHHLGTSVGISLFPADTYQATALVNYADMAMYEAKSGGGRGYRFYYEDLNTNQHRQLVLENELHGAIADDAFLVYYQPIVDLKTGEVVAVEALMRWRHPRWQHQGTGGVPAGAGGNRSDCQHRPFPVPPGGEHTQAGPRD